MKKLLLSFLLIPMVLVGQKNNNGKVYDKHPAIGIVEQFTDAWISGDTEKLKNLTGEGFKMGSSMNNNPNYKPLPPFREGCATIEEVLPIGIIYPKSKSKIYVPVKLDGTLSKTVFEASHRDNTIKIYWHLEICCTRFIP